MKYITGVYALNLYDQENSSGGDWHFSSLNWDRVTYNETDGSFYGNYGVSKRFSKRLNKEIIVANHIRACLYLLLLGKFNQLEGCV